MTTATFRSDRLTTPEAIDGYLELGMEKEALEQIDATLLKADITSEEFDAAVFGLLQVKDPLPWKQKVEAAYRRLEEPVNARIRSDMLNFYSTLEEFELAYGFLPRSRSEWNLSADLYVVMRVCLELNELTQAEKVARYCQLGLARAKDDFTRASLGDALASYYLRRRQWDKALEVWEKAPSQTLFLRSTHCGIVGVHLARALEAARNGIRKITGQVDSLDLSLEVQMPGNDVALQLQAREALEELERQIEKLFDQDEQGRFGLIPPTARSPKRGIISSKP